MNLAKTSFLNGISVIVRLGTGVLLNKILAIYVGPSGYAILGQLQNIFAMISTFATGAVNTGVTKYTAEFHDQPDRQRQLWRTAGTITICGSITTGLLLFLFRDVLSTKLFGTAAYSHALAWLAASLTFISFNSFLLAILSGKKEVSRFILASIAGSIIGLIVSGALAWQMGLQGALIALSAGQAVSLIATLLACRSLPWSRVANLTGRIDRATTRKLGNFIAMALTSAIVVPTTQILIRMHIQGLFGASHAGYWDATNKISTIYLSFATTTLSLYYLPRISEIRDGISLKREILAGYRIILPATVFAAVVLYANRQLLVKFLFTPDFMPMTSLMGWQMIGDVLKISSWLLGYVLIGRAMTKQYIVTEVVFSASLYILTLIITEAVGYTGVAVAYAVNYLAYLVTVYWLIFSKTSSTTRTVRR